MKKMNLPPMHKPKMLSNYALPNYRELAKSAPKLAVSPMLCGACCGGGRVEARRGRAPQEKAQRENAQRESAPATR